MDGFSHESTSAEEPEDNFAHEVKYRFFVGIAKIWARKEEICFKNHTASKILQDGVTD